MGAMSLILKSIYFDGTCILIRSDDDNHSEMIIQTLKIIGGRMCCGFSLPLPEAKLNPEISGYK